MLSACCICLEGKTFLAPFIKGQKEIKKVFPIPFKSSSSGNKNSQPALCQWSEVQQHPGLLCCLTHSGGVPVVMMVKPDQIQVSCCTC